RIVILLLLLIGFISACKEVVERRDVRPLVMHDVPARNLAFRFEADTGLPAEAKLPDTEEKAAIIQTEFLSNRKNDALFRTVPSPDGRRLLALYGTAEQPDEAFRIDLFADDGKFVRKITPPNMSCVFPEAVAWSPDGNFITFIPHRNS